MHTLPVQLQPVPAIEASVKPPGSVSVTVTVPLVAAAPDAFDTVTVYASPLCPCVKLPLCVDATLNTAALPSTTVLSVPDALADPPPDTLTEFVSCELALAATFTVTAIAG